MDDRNLNVDASDTMMALTLEQIKWYLEALEDDENWKEKAISYLDRLIKIVDDRHC